MFTVVVESTFVASHRVRLHSGELEPVHSHDWHVRAAFSRPRLDDHEMVVDFLAAHDALTQVLAVLDGTDLNQNPAFARRNPTAEVVAHYVLSALRDRGFPTANRVEVTEAPGCVAVFELPPPNGE